MCAVLCTTTATTDFDSLCHLDAAEARLKFINCEKSCLKPNLRTFVNINDNAEIQAVVKENPSRLERSLITKVNCGVLPIALKQVSIRMYY